jgi:MinD superfamily P-loop ATPase
MVDASEADETPPPWVARERARVLAQETRRVARIAPFACIAASGCSVCSERCPEPGAIALARGRPVVEASLCTGCGACHEACPAPLRAIQLLPVLPARP